VCGWVRFCLDCGDQMLQEESPFILISILMIDWHWLCNRLSERLQSHPSIWCRLNLGGQNWPWPAGMKQSVSSLYVCVCSQHIRKLYIGQVPQIRLLDYCVHECVCNCMPDRMCSSSLFYPGKVQLPSFSLLFFFL